MRRALREQGLYPYRISMLHELTPPDYPRRVEFCQWFRNQFGENVGNMETIFFSDEAWFHLSGYVNAQNYRIWSANNPHVFEETPLHPVKVGVWCALSQHRVVGPIFFDESVNAERYQEIMQNFIALLNSNERRAWFQQDNAPAHTANSTTCFLNEFFEDRVIGRGRWPARSPDLSPVDFFLWGYLKEKVYRNKPQTSNELKTEIEAAISNIDEHMLQRVFNNLIRRLKACEDIGGGHFQHFNL